MMIHQQPVFRNPDKFQVLPFREWIRKNLPTGSQGLVVEDLDIVMRVYGTRYMTDAAGKVMFIELKYFGSWIGTAQEKTFKLIHLLMRGSDPKRERYRGYFVVNYNNDDWDKSQFWINHKLVSTEEFVDFMQLKDIGIMGLWETILGTGND